VAEMRKWTPCISGYFGTLAMTAVRAADNKTSKINLKIETFLISRIFGLRSAIAELGVELGVFYLALFIPR